MRKMLVQLLTLSIIFPVFADNSSKEDVASQQSARARAVINALTDASIEPARRVRGKGFEWDHEIQVALPPSYHKTKKAYPVLWVTDGSFSFEMAARLVNLEIKAHIPELIVVAVGVPQDEADQLIHRRPYEFSLPGEPFGFEGFGGSVVAESLATVKAQLKEAGRPAWEVGGAPQFLDFLVDQLRPMLAENYRMTDDHTLFGDSSGGFFCVYALLARTDAFSKYICGSPNLRGSNFALFKMEEQYAQEHDDLKATVFFGAGEAEVLNGGGISAWGHFSATARMVEILGLRNYPSLNLHVRIFPGENHMSVVPLNLSWGLRTLWQEGKQKP